MKHIVKEKRNFMKRKLKHNVLILNLLLALFCSLWSIHLLDRAKINRLKENTIISELYREQNIGEGMVQALEKGENPGKKVGIYLLETKFGYQKSKILDNDKWLSQKAWKTYYKYTSSIWNDLEYFPVPISTTEKKYTVSYSNSWFAERTYGGKRGHEGTDIMADVNVRGIYPVLSMTDGVVTKKGWLEKGGYRIGVTTSEGAYFYYAHLASYADIEVGDEIKAGDILGFMGDSGYGEEGTTGKFPVHLHVGIYIYPNGEEISVNPYWALRFLEKYKISFAY